MLVAGAVLPALLTAAVGLLHPVFLEPETAERWRLVHLLLLPLFPLVGASVWIVLLGVRGAAAWLARGLAAAFAVLYSALDSIAGIGAPAQVLAASARGDGRPPIEDLYAVGDRLGQLGVVALALAGVVTAGVLWRRRAAAAALGGLAVLGGCYLVYRHHVFPPRGVTGALLLAVGLGLLTASRPALADAPPVRA